MKSALSRYVLSGRLLRSNAALTRALRLAAIAAVLPAMTIVTLAGESLVSEYAVKAAYLFNFGKFVRFTPSPAVDNRNTFDICVIGRDPLGSTLDDLTANERLDGKAVRVLRFRSAVEARGCAIAFISPDEGDRTGQDLERLRNHEVLTVGDASDFLRRGGMIQFVTIDDHVRFAVNLDAVRNAHIGLSSELLRVAISVDGSNAAEVRP